MYYVSLWDYDEFVSDYGTELEEAWEELEEFEED